MLTRRTLLGLLAAGSAGGALDVAAGGPVADTADVALTATPRTATSRINAWLARDDLGTGYRRLRGTVVLTTPLIVPAGVHLDATGADVTGPRRDNLLRNAAAVPLARTSGSIRARSTTLTTTHPVFAQATVGQRVQVVGVGPRAGHRRAPGSLYARITEVTSPRRVSLDLPADSTDHEATVYLHAPVDVGITIRGGTWTNRNKNRIAQTTQSHGVLIRRAADLTLTGMTVRSVGGPQIGGQYGVALGDVTRVTVTDLRFVDTASDGLHVTGPAQDVVVRRLSGRRTGDDLLAFTTVDGQTRDGSRLGDCEGDITDVVVEDLHSDECHSLLKLTSGIGAGGRQRHLERFSATGVHGAVTGASPVNVLDYAGPTWFSGTISDVTATHVGSPSVNVQASRLGRVTVSDVAWPASARAPKDGVVSFTGASAESITVRGVTSHSVAGRSDQPGCAVRLAVRSVREVHVEGTRCPVLAPHFDTVQLGAPRMRIQLLTIADDRSAARTGDVLSLREGSGRYRIGTARFTDLRRTGGSVWAADEDGESDAPATSITVEGLQGGRALAILRSPARITLRGVRQRAGSDAAVRLVSAAASPVRVLVDDAQRRAPLVSRTGRQEVSVVSTAIGTDVRELTPFPGDVVRNTGRQPAPGVLEYRTGSGWVAADG
ncbi:hypothetical protein AABM26_12510 [Curtobacterium aetherium]|uniref:hypothetical protein n=1 Tax=Curtobacterium aetherium TaxID=2841594 RepID=UPI003B51D2E2